jgi:hypothetical protein
VTGTRIPEGPRLPEVVGIDPDSIESHAQPEGAIYGWPHRDIVRRSGFAVGVRFIRHQDEIILWRHNDPRNNSEVS